MKEELRELYEEFILEMHKRDMYGEYYSSVDCFLKWLITGDI